MTDQPAQPSRVQNRTDLWNHAARTIRANVLADNITPGDILDLATWLDTGCADGLGHWTLRTRRQVRETFGAAPVRTRG